MKKVLFIGIFFVLILSIVFISLISGDGPQCTKMDYDGNSQSCSSTHFLWKRTATANIYKNLQTGEYTKTIGQGIINLDSEDRRNPHYKQRSEFFGNSSKGFQDNTGFIYNLSDNKKFVNVYDRHGNYMSSFGFAITGTIGGQNYEVSSLSYDWTWNKKINETEAYFEGDNNNNFHWVQKYHLYPEKNMKIENYVENNVADITNGKFWYIQTVNQSENVTWNGHTYSLGSTHHLEGNYDKILPNVIFPDYYVFNYRDLIENGFNITDIYIGDGSVVGADGTWILAVGVTKNNGNFPKGASVTLDPTITLQDANTENLADAWISLVVSPDYNGGTDTFLGIGDEETSGEISYSFISFNISSITSDILSNLTTARMMLYSTSRPLVGTEQDIALYNCSNVFGETTINGTNYESQTTCEDTSIRVTPQGHSSNDQWINFDITSYLNDSLQSGKKNITFSLRNSTTIDSWTVYFDSKEYTGDISLRPKIEIRYYPYIDVISPSPSQIFTEDVPTTKFELDTAVEMDTCYWSEDPGGINHTLTKISTFNYSLTNTSMVDGPHTVIFWCNQSSDGTWRTSDPVSFDVDSVNVTVCRDLTVANREYELLNNITTSGNCFNIYSNNITLNGNNYNLSSDSTGNGIDGFSTNINYTIENITISSFMDCIDSVSGAGITARNIFLESCSSSGIDTQSANYFSISNFTINNSGEYGIWSKSGTTNLTNGKILNSGIYDIRQTSEEGDLTALNVSYSLENSDITLIRKWYFETQVNDSSGYLQNAQVDIYDKDNNLLASEFTDANGQINRQEITEYIDNAGTKTFKTPHTINISKTGYITNSTVYNLTTEQNVNHIVTLQDTNDPPTSILYYPSNNSWSNSLLNTFISNQTDSDGNLANATIYTWINGAEESHNTKSITGATNSTTWTNFGFVGEGSYEWNVYVCDDKNSCVWNSSNWTLNIDTTNPLISYGINTENNDTNFSRNWIYINTSYTETNFKNISFYLFDETFSPIQSSTNTIGTAYHNFTSLSDGTYYYNVTIRDKATNSNSTETRKITIDDTAPSVNIIYPINLDAYNDNPIWINYTVSDNLIGLDSCWWTNDSGAENHSITCGANFTQALPDGSYTYVIYSNDSLNNLGSDVVNFDISTNAPAIILDHPTNNQYLSSGTNIDFNFTATDSDGLSICQLWGNWSGWHLNYTWNSPTSGNEETVDRNLAEGIYKYGVWCNDTVGNSGFSNNKTFQVDETSPNVVQDSYSPSTLYNNLNLTIFGNATDSHLDTVWLQINYSGSYQNITIVNKVGDKYNYTLDSSEISNRENISWRWWANDSASNINSSSLLSIVVTNRNPYDLVIVSPPNESYINTDYLDVTFTATDDDLDTLNYSLYYANQSLSFSLFNYTTSGELNLTGFNYTNGATNYFYVNVSDGYLTNQTENYTFYIDTINPTLVLDKPEASPVYQCSVAIIWLNYTANDSNLDHCEFNVTSGGEVSSPNTIISDCSNTSFSVLYDNSVQILTLVAIDKAGNRNTTTRLIYVDTDNAGCSAGTTNPSGGSSTVVVEENKEDVGFCGDGVCKKDRGESYWTCPSDCSNVKDLSGILDGVLFNCLDDKSKETECFWTSNPGWIALFVFGAMIFLFFTLFKLEPTRKGTQRIIFIGNKKKYKRR